MRRDRAQIGMSLVEATIILLVLMLLTSVLAPSIFDYFRDSQMVKVKEDCEAIGSAVTRLVRDVGPCLLNGNGPTCTLDSRAEILWSDGPPVRPLGGNTSVDTQWFPINGGTATHGPYNWFNDPTMGPANHGTPLAGQLVSNWSAGDPSLPGAPIYQTVTGGQAWSGPALNLGWRGAYVAPPIGPDPWGLPYFVNSVFLSVARDADLARPGGPYQAAIGKRDGAWPYDVFCISAGPNRSYETMFAPNTGTGPYGTVRGGDDFIYIISGGTR